MIIVGEKINTSRKAVGEAVEQGNADFIKRLAKEQIDAGANFIDINAGTFPGRETELLCWLVETVQSEFDVPLCLDSPDPESLSEAIKIHKGEPMINSISLEEDRFNALIPVVTSTPCHVVALCMAQTMMPTTVEERVETGTELINRLTDRGAPIEKIYVDPLVQPISVDTRMALGALGAIREIMTAFPGVNTICGLSNISFGLPARKLINRTFLALALDHGLNAAIIDPTDSQLIETLLAAEMLLDKDEYCQNYIEAYQNGLFAG